MENQNEHEIPTDLPRVGKKTVTLFSVGAVVIFAALFVIGYIPHRQRMRAAREVAGEHDSKPVVEVMVPKRTNASSDLVLPADVRALQETSIYPRANGYLKRLLVDIGDRVKAGQLLAEIDTPEVDAQLNESRAALEQSKANLTKSETDFALSQSTFARYQSLAKTGAITQQELDEKQSGFNQARSALNAAKATVTASEAAVQRLAELQSFEKVTAPFAGVIAARNYDVGALLNPANNGAGKELFRVAETDTLRMFVNVPQVYVSSIREGQDAFFESRDQHGRTFKGKVSRSAGAIDPATRTMRFQVNCPNPDALLWAGMYGQVRFPITQSNQPLVIPSSAMLMVAVVDDANRIRFHKVTVGRDFGTEMEVLDGLSGGEEVVSNPGQRLVDGVEVQVASPQNDVKPPTPRQATASK
jgi:RND family efflux transporter MFP subunit